MAHAAKKAEKPKTAKPTTDLIGNPERRTIIFVAAAMVLLAIVAVALNTISSRTGCGGIVLSMQRYQCYDNLAQSTGDVAYCMKSGVYEQNCALSLANKNANVTYCKVLSGVTYTGCIENVSIDAMDPSYCSMLSGNNASSCYYKYENQINFSTESYCGSITNSTYRNNCRYSYDYMRAISTGQNSYCSMLPETENESLMYNLSKLGNASVRENYGFYSYLNTTPSQYCYNVEGAITLAKGKNPINSTSNMSIYALNNTQISSECGVGNYIVSQNATASALSSICGYAFYTQRAIYEKNTSECDLISSQNFRYSCIENLAISTQNALVCNYLGSQSEASSCEYAVSLNETGGSG